MDAGALGDSAPTQLELVKKWLKRFREAQPPSVAMFKSQSRAPHHRPFQIVPLVRDAILSLRDELKQRYGRVVGAKTILYHLHHEGDLASRSVYLPHSPRKIWQISQRRGKDTQGGSPCIIRWSVRSHSAIGRWISGSWAMPLNS